jgi:hypothetical protein
MMNLYKVLITAFVIKAPYSMMSRPSPMTRMFFDRPEAISLFKYITNRMHEVRF